MCPLGWVDVLKVSRGESDKSGQQDWPIWRLMRGGRNLDIGIKDSPPRA